MLKPILYFCMQSYRISTFISTLNSPSMNFTTVVHIPSTNRQIQHEHQLMMLGSCFTEHIGERLQNAKFNIDINPFGIQYNPMSIATALNHIIEQKLYAENDLFLHEGRWHSFMHHSRFSSTTADEAFKLMNTRIKASAEYIKKAEFLFITFGTAWVYELKKSGEIVSNCHKLPDNEFIRRRLTVNEIVQTYAQLMKRLNEINPKLKLIFTVSPIRHWKDGAHENNVSKSILLLAIEELQQQYDTIGYFPAYEIQMDELRDYRFYAEDMLHPNKVAIDYIWERFSNVYFSEKTQVLAQEMSKLKQAFEHRPFNATGGEFQQFLYKQRNKVEKYKRDYPFLNFDEELQKLESNI